MLLWQLLISQLVQQALCNVCFSQMIVYSIMFGWSYSAYIGSSGTSISGGQWVGGILVGVVSGVLVVLTVWVIVTIVRKKKTDIKNIEER